MNWSDECSLIWQNVYVGSLAAAQNLDSLIDKGITHVLTAAGRLDVKYPESMNIAHLILHDFNDHPMTNLLEELPRAVEFMDISHEGKRQRKVLIHCASGISRSVSICCGWLIIRKQMSFEEAFNMIRQFRPRANPNVGFRAQLKTLEDCKGDVRLALTTHNSLLCGNSINDILRNQRETACKFQEEITDIENQMKEYDEITLENHLKYWKTSMTAIEAKIEEENDRVKVLFQDMPSKSMRKSAMERVTKMLLDFRYETGLNC